MVHEKVRKICQRLTSGGKLPIQNGNHTCLTASNTRLLNICTMKMIFIKITVLPLLDEISYCPTENLRGQVWPHYPQRANFSSTNQTAGSWQECLRLQRLCTALSTWSPFNAKHLCSSFSRTFSFHEYNILIYLSLAVAGSFSKSFEVQWDQVQWV